MTIEDRVDDIGDWRDPDARNHAIRVMRAAVEEEREACAKIVDNYMRERLNQSNAARSNGHEETARGYQDLGAQCKLIIDAIRARSTASDRSAAPAEK